MKSIITTALAFVTLFFTAGCNSGDNKNTTSTNDAPAPGTGQSGVKDDQSAKNVVQIAIGSKDHTTLVTAVKAAELVDVLSNAGPFTVFAPTNAAFDKLPAGVFKEDMLQEGQSIGQVNGGNITISKKDGKIMVNGVANVVASVQASNGIVHIIDAVLLPPPVK